MSLALILANTNRDPNLMSESPGTHLHRIPGFRCCLYPSHPIGAFTERGFFIRKGNTVVERDVP